MCQMCELNFVGFAEPQEAMLDGFRDALARGWEPSLSAPINAKTRAAVADDASAYLAAMADSAPLDASGVRPNMPSRMRWVWDGDFCGMVNLRWLPGTTDLPPHVYGHIGYGIVPWKRGHGIAKKALRHMLFEAREVGLSHVDICTTADNVASQRVIIANGGGTPTPFRASDDPPDLIRLRYRVAL